MKRISTILLAALSAVAGGSASAQSFFCTDAPERLLSYSVHAGVNVSNVTVNKGVYDRWNHNAWGSGVEIGAQVGIHFKDYLCIRPGFFLESRSGNYAYDMTAEQPGVAGAQEVSFVQLGHYRTWHLNIPVMCQVSFNLSDDLRWNVEAGPYVSWRFAGDDASDVTAPSAPGIRPVLGVLGGVDATGTKTVDRRKFDAGLRIGTGLEWRRHWSLAVHYLAGGCSAWRAKELGGRNKTWTFTLGYGF